MITDLDIWRSASVLVAKHGEFAAIEAAMRADDFLERGNVDGERLWLRIRRAVLALRGSASTEHR